MADYDDNNNNFGESMGENQYFGPTRHFYPEDVKEMKKLLDRDKYDELIKLRDELIKKGRFYME